MGVVGYNATSLWFIGEKQGSILIHIKRLLWSLSQLFETCGLNR